MLTCEVRDAEGNPIFGLMIDRGIVSYVRKGYEYLYGLSREEVEAWCEKHDYTMEVIDEEAQATR